MLFFRSEEHLKNWAQYDPATKDGICQLDGLLTMFSGNLFKSRLDTDYITKMRDYLGELIGAMGSNDRVGAFLKT
mgnify:CR=1 FL=1